MLKILILVCPIALNHLVCTRDNAIDVVRTMSVSSPQQCGFMAQALLAQTSLVPKPGEQYMKIVCVREADDAVAVAKR